MKTEVIKIHPEFPESDKIAKCAKVIRQGGLVVFPTETVYGIAADFNNEKAIKRLREVKGRAENKPFSIHISQKELLPNYTPSKDPIIYKLIDACWPGPLTVIVPSYEADKTIGIRMPENNIAIKLVEESQCTVAAPSANFTGKPAPSTCEEAMKDLDGLVDMAIDGGSSKFGLASSVVDCMQEKPVVLRKGAISQEQVDKIANKKAILFICTGNSCRSVMGEYFLREKLKDRDDIEVLSAGTSVFLRSSASKETISVLEREGIDVRHHQARPMTNIMLHKADLILVMTKLHRSQVLGYVPDVEQRVHLLKEFISDSEEPTGDFDIEDPMGLPSEAYEECAITVKNAVEKLIQKI